MVVIILLRFKKVLVIVKIIPTNNKQTFKLCLLKLLKRVKLIKTNNKTFKINLVKILKDLSQNN